MAEGRTAGLARVVVLVRHGVLPMELGLVYELFRGSRRLPAPYAVSTCTPVAGDVRTAADFSLTGVAGPEVLDELGPGDTLVVPASHEQDEALAGGVLSAELAAALSRVPDTVRVASVCTGAFVLAAAGLLDGRRATTHWRTAELLARSFPRVRVDPDVLYTQDGRVFTSAGEAAGIDLCLHLIRLDHGAAVANVVARDMVVPPHRDGGQAQFIPTPVPDPEPAAATTAAARSWALRHLDRPLGLAELAQRENVSVRTFTRRFRAETGQSPTNWLTLRRLDRARELLEHTDLPVEMVAARAGLGTATSLRQHFHTTLGTTPSAYRATFRGPDGRAPRTREPVTPVPAPPDV